MKNDTSALERITVKAFAFGDPVLPGLAKVVEESGEVVEAITRVLRNDQVDQVEPLHADMMAELADLSAGMAVFARLNDCTEYPWRHAATHPASLDLDGWLLRLLSSIGPTVQVGGKLMMTHGQREHWQGDTFDSLCSCLAVTMTDLALFVGTRPEREQRAFEARWRGKWGKFMAWDRDPGADPPPMPPKE